MASELRDAPVDWAAWRAELLRELTDAIADVAGEDGKVGLVVDTALLGTLNAIVLPVDSKLDPFEPLVRAGLGMVENEDDLAAQLQAQRLRRDLEQKGEKDKAKKVRIPPVRKQHYFFPLHPGLPSQAGPGAYAAAADAPVTSAAAVHGSRPATEAPTPPPAFEADLLDASRPGRCADESRGGGAVGGVWSPLPRVPADCSRLLYVTRPCLESAAAIGSHLRQWGSIRNGNPPVPSTWPSDAIIEAVADAAGGGAGTTGTNSRGGSTAAGGDESVKERNELIVEAATAYRLREYPRPEHISVRFVPRRSGACESLWREEEVRSELQSIGSIRWDLVPLDDDVVTSADPGMVRRLFVERDASAGLELVAPLARMQEVFGPFATIKAKGEHAVRVADGLLRVRSELVRHGGGAAGAGSGAAGAGGRGSARGTAQFAGSGTASGLRAVSGGYDMLILLDRETDWVTPLVTPLTLEALIAERGTGYDMGGEEGSGVRDGCIQVDLGPEAGDGSESKTAGADSAPIQRPTWVPFNSSVLPWVQARDMLMQRAMSSIKEQFVDWQRRSRQHHDMQISEISRFVKGGRLQELRAEKLWIGRLLRASEQAAMLALKEDDPDSDDFMAQWLLEKKIIDGQEKESTLHSIRKGMHEGRPMLKSLRLLCLYSVCSNGLSDEEIKAAVTDLCQCYDPSEAMLAAVALRKCGLLRSRAASGLLAAFSSSTTATGASAGVVPGTPWDWGSVSQALRVTEVGVQPMQKEEPADTAYVTMGTAPVSVRLVELALRSLFPGDSDAFSCAAARTGGSPSSGASDPTAELGGGALAARQAGYGGWSKAAAVGRAMPGPVREVVQVEAVRPPPSSPASQGGSRRGQPPRGAAASGAGADRGGQSGQGGDVRPPSLPTSPEDEAAVRHCSDRGWCQDPSGALSAQALGLRLGPAGRAIEAPQPYGVRKAEDTVRRLQQQRRVALSEGDRAQLREAMVTLQYAAPRAIEPSQAASRRRRKAVFVYVLGGVTQMEVSALRLVSDRLPVDVTVGGSCLLSGSEIVRGLLGKPFDGVQAVKTLAGVLPYQEKKKDSLPEGTEARTRHEEDLEELETLAVEDPADREM